MTKGVQGGQEDAPRWRPSAASVEHPKSSGMCVGAVQSSPEVALPGVIPHRDEPLLNTALPGSPSQLSFPRKPKRQTAITRAVKPSSMCFSAWRPPHAPQS